MRVQGVQRGFGMETGREKPIKTVEADGGVVSLCSTTPLLEKVSDLGVASAASPFIVFLHSRFIG